MRSQIIRQLRLLHSYRASDPIEEDLRGWNYHMPPIKPRRYLSLSIGDVAYKYCPTKRDVYLRRVLRIQGEQKPVIHEIIRYVSNEMTRLLYSGFETPLTFYLGNQHREFKTESSSQVMKSG